MTQAPKGMFEGADLLAGTTPTSQPMPGEPEKLNRGGLGQLPSAPQPTESLPTDTKRDGTPSPLDEFFARTPTLKTGSVRIENGCPIPDDWEATWKMACTLAAARLNRGSSKNPVYWTVSQWCIVLNYGYSIGLTFGQILAFVTLVNDKPCVWGDGALGLVMSKPRFADMEEVFEGDGDNAVAVCRVWRRKRTDPRDPQYHDDLRLIERRFSVQDAKRANLLEKYGPWTQGWSKRMLQMRARMFALRDGFADVLGGLAFAEEQEATSFNADRMVAVAPVLTDNAAGREIAAALPREGVTNGNQ